MTTLAPSWSERLNQLLPQLIEFRRHLHAHPELSGEEHQTAALIAGELREAGWRVREANRLRSPWWALVGVAGAWRRAPRLRHTWLASVDQFGPRPASAQCPGWGL